MGKLNMVKLGDVCRIQGGYVFKSCSFIKNEIPIIRIGNIKNDMIELDNDVCCTTRFWKDNEQYRVLNGDILIAMSGATIGKTGKYTLNQPAILNQRVGRFILNDKELFGNYLFYYVKSDLFVKNVLHYALGCVQPNISAKQIEELFLPFPPIETQKQIAKILDSAAELVTLRKQRLVELDNLIRSVFYNMFGDLALNDRNWEQVYINDIYKIIDGDRGNNYPKKDDFYDDGYCLFLNTGNVTKEGFNFDNLNFITKEKDNKLRNGKLKQGDIVLTTRGTIGNLAYYDEKVYFDNIRINSCMAILRDDLKKTTPHFFITLLKSIEMKKKIKNRLSGAAQQQLPITNIKKILIPLPPISLQIQFSSIVKKIEEQKTEVIKSIKENQLLLYSLINSYFE